MRYKTPTAAQAAQWKKEVADLPRAVREVAERFDPWSLYKLKNTGQIVSVTQFDLLFDGSVEVRIGIEKKYNPDIPKDLQVFAIKPDDLGSIPKGSAKLRRVN